MDGWEDEGSCQRKGEVVHLTSKANICDTYYMLHEEVNISSDETYARVHGVNTKIYMTMLP